MEVVDRSYNRACIYLLKVKIEILEEEVKYVQS